ncbi:MAG: SH3 domain-containing protein [Desulfobacterales bacterium]|nr:SH3 domain-containing protein [Desulfobacterales bacterium]
MPPDVPEGKYRISFRISSQGKEDQVTRDLTVKKGLAMGPRNQPRPSQTQVASAPRADSSNGAKSVAAAPDGKAAKAKERSLVITGKKINVRKGPSSKADVIAVVKDGEVYPVVQSSSAADGAWHLIRLDDGEEDTGARQVRENEGVTVMTMVKRSLFVVLLVAFVVCAAPHAPAEQSPVTDSHVDRINSIFRQNGIRAGSVVLDMYGRLELKGEYADEQEVDRAFSLAQTVVGVRWVSPVTPENIKVKEWERRLGGLFSRARVLKPTVRGDDAPGPIRNRYALVVGVGQFKYGINTLHYAVQDATSFRQFLTDQRRGGSRMPMSHFSAIKAQRGIISPGH